MKQHFRVGEIVILKSLDYPQHNGGPYVIKKIEPAGLSATGTGSQHGLKVRTEEIFYHIDGIDLVRYQSKALKKYHPPSTQTFHEIIEGLKQPVKT